VPKGHVDDAEAEFRTPLKLIEENWGLSIPHPADPSPGGNGLTHSAGACR
jgi:hypothetical protein